MSTDKPKSEINPFVKTLLEMGPIVLFFIAYIRLKDRVFNIGGTDYDGFIIVTAAFVILLIITNGILWMLTGKLSKMQIATLVLVVVFGGMTVWLNAWVWIVARGLLPQIRDGRDDAVARRGLDASDQTRHTVLLWAGNYKRAGLAQYHNGNLGLFQNLRADDCAVRVLYDAKQTVANLRD